MFRAHVLIIRRSEFHYTASGIITPIGGHPVHRLREDSQPVHKTATNRYDDTRGCIMQFWPPDDEHMCSKHVEAWNRLIVKQKFCASSWLVTKTNILKCTVSKTSKLWNPVWSLIACSTSFLILSFYVYLGLPRGSFAQDILTSLSAGYYISNPSYPPLFNHRNN